MASALDPRDVTEGPIENCASVACVWILALVKSIWVSCRLWWQRRARQAGHARLMRRFSEATNDWLIANLFELRIVVPVDEDRQAWNELKSKLLKRPSKIIPDTIYTPGHAGFDPNLSEFEVVFVDRGKRVFARSNDQAEIADSVDISSPGYDDDDVLSLVKCDEDVLDGMEDIDYALELCCRASTPVERPELTFTNLIHVRFIKTDRSTLIGWLPSYIKRHLPASLATRTSVHLVLNQQSVNMTYSEFLGFIEWLQSPWNFEVSWGNEKCFWELSVFSKRRARSQEGV